MVDESSTESISTAISLVDELVDGEPHGDVSCLKQIAGSISDKTIKKGANKLVNKCHKVTECTCGVSLDSVVYCVYCIDCTKCTVCTVCTVLTVLSVLSVLCVLCVLSVPCVLGAMLNTLCRSRVES